MKVAVLTVEGFNELDSFIASAMLNRAKIQALIVCPSERVASADVPACTDSTTKPWVQEAGVKVLEQPFVAHGNVATTGGCLASHYLAAWVTARLAGWRAAAAVLHYVAPVGQKEEYVARAFSVLKEYLPMEVPA